MAVALVWLCSATAPAAADAFVGEEVVINGEKLSKEAEEFLKSVVDEKKLFEGNGGPPDVPIVEDAGWWSWGEGSGFLPVVGGLVAFGVGVGVGQEACETILEPLLGEPYCFGAESTEPDPIPAKGSGEWVWRNQPSSWNGFPLAPGYVFYWQPKEWGVEPLPWQGYGGEPSCGFPPPSGVQAFYPEGNGEAFCEGKTWKTEKGVLIRTAAGRTLVPRKVGELPKATSPMYCPAASPTTCTTGPSSNWSHRAAECLRHPSSCSITEKQRDQIAQQIASEIPAGQEAGVASPYAVTVTVPECRGQTYGWCHERGLNRNLVPSREELTWETADTGLPAEHVVYTRPAGGTVVESGTGLIVITNPDAEHMPAVIPEISRGESYSEYITRLAPSLKPERVNVSDANQDAGVGPDAALRTNPVAGTEENPAISTTVTVYTNPPDAPAPFETGGCNVGIGGLDFAPLNQPLGSKFPFGIFAFFVHWVGEWSGPGAPSWTVTLVPTGVFGSRGLHIHIELASMLPIAEIVRVAFLFASFVGLLWFLGTGAAWIQGDSS